MIIAYVGSQIPTLSETFVYRELLGLRARGHQVIAVSVRAPKRAFGSAELDQLASSAIEVYTKANFAKGCLIGLFRPRLGWCVLRDCLLATLSVLNSLTPDNTAGSTHYHADYVWPRWRRNMKRLKKIGRHIFYRTYNGGWS